MAAQIEMTVDEFKAYLAANDQAVEEKKATGPGGEVTIRLELFQKKKLRIGWWVVMAWAAFTVLGGNWFSIPVFFLFCASAYNIVCTRKATEELLAGLKAAGILEEVEGS